VPTIDTCWGQ